MLRVGLTGGIGSGKSTVAKLLAERGAVVFSSDAMGHELMQPGTAVYDAIVRSFGPTVVAADNTLDRRRLAQLAFDPAHPRIEELNAIIHPAVLAEQARLLDDLARTQPNAIAVIESALLFSTKYATDWPARFDRILLVTAPLEQRIARLLSRGMTEADARRRIAAQPDLTAFAHQCIVIPNDGDLPTLGLHVNRLWSFFVEHADQV